MPSEDSKSTAGLMYLLSIILGLFSGLIFMLLKKEDAFVAQESKESLNWGINLLIATIAVSLVFSLVSAIHFVGSLIQLGLFVANIVFAIQGFNASKQGQAYKYPFMPLRLIK